MATRIQLRRGAAAQWTSANPVLASGEPAVETDTGKSKIGDGVTAWADLPYDVSADDLAGKADAADLGTAAAADVRDFISAAQPESYGAVGDGIVDDTDAVQAALNAGAGGIVLLTGTYGFSKTLVVPGHTRVEGGGTLKLLAGYDLTPLSFRAGDMMYPYIMAAGDGVVLHDLTVIGTTEDTRAQRHIGVLFVDCTRGRAENLDVQHINWDPALAASSGESLGYGLGTVRATNITIRGGSYEYGGYQNIGIADGSRNILVDGVYCGAGWRTSLQIHRDVWDVDVVNSTITNTEATAHSAFTIHPIASAPTGRVRISSTRIKAITDPEMNQVGGLQLVDTVDGISLTDVDIESNKWGIYLLARGASLANVRVVASVLGLDFSGDDLSIEGGKYVVTGGTLYAIEVRTGSTNVRLSGVMMDATAAATALRAGGDNISIRGCTMRGNVFGANIFGVASKRMSLVDSIVESNTNAAIYNNTIDGPNGASLTIRGNVITAGTGSNGRGIWIVSNVIGAVIQGNTIIRARVGVQIDATATKAIVKDNNLLGVAVTPLDISAPDSIVQDNLVPA